MRLTACDLKVLLGDDLKHMCIDLDPCATYQNVMILASSAKMEVDPFLDARVTTMTMSQR